MTFNIEKYLEIKEFIKNFNTKRNINIVVVSKTHQLTAVKEALRAGVRNFGEIRVNEAIEKFKILKKEHEDLKLHMIGGLQTNKTKKAMEIFDFFHSLDRESLALEFSKHKELLINKSFFIQVNTGNEIQKSGINIDYASDFVNYCTLDLKLNIIGLMCLPPFEEDPKKHFMLLNDIANKNNLKHLSMGMSADYKIALNCGASFIRIGSTLFGERK